MSFNQQLFVFINKFFGVNDRVDSLGVFFAEYTPYFFILVLLFYWFYKRNKYQETVLYAGYSVVVGLLLNSLIVIFYSHNRPFIEGFSRNITNHVADSSFPSDHTTFMLSIAISFLFFPKNRKIGFFLFLIGLASGFSRVFIGVHYPLDIFGSVGTAFFAGFLIFYFRGRLERINQFFYKIDRIFF